MRRFVFIHPSTELREKMGHLQLKAFVFDIDGTLCDYNGVLNLEAAHSIRWLRSLGYEVLLASGRGPWDTFYLGVFLSCSKIAVCENGGVLMTSPSDMKIYADKTASLEAYDTLSKNISDVRVKPVSARLTEVVLLRTFEASDGQKILDRAGIGVSINDSKFALHLTKKGITKAIALREALNFMKLDPGNVAVVGDSATDVPMFDLCGYSAAVGNASDEVKSKASYACRLEIGEGAVEAISHIINQIADQKIS